MQGLLSNSKKLVTTFAIVAMGISTAALAHHGFGRFDRANDAVFTGTITDIDFVNPHAYLYFDAVTSSGEVIEMRCEMRAATLMRRSGWTREMFANGLPVNIYGFRHREDPGSCYVEEITIGDAPTLNRNDQLETPEVDLSQREYRLPNGTVNLNGDWAQEQYVIARPPSGEGIGLVPKSMKPGIEAGTIEPSTVPNSGWGPRPVTLTARGQTEADAFATWSVADNPRLRCQPTSILFDWVFDGPVNRITQGEDRIVIDYGLYSFQRVIHMNMDAHPANITPSYSGHSIGHWEGDTLVVDTIGFEPGVLAAPIKHSNQLHIVERYTLDPETFLLTRDYVAEDPVYFTDQWIGQDVAMLASVPYEKHECDELTFEFLEFQPSN
jgi:hypothetical protein